jgi:hypothetical protein
MLVLQAEMTDVAKRLETAIQAMELVETITGKIANAANPELALTNGESSSSSGGGGGDESGGGGGGGDGGSSGGSSNRADNGSRNRRVLQNSFVRRHATEIAMVAGFILIIIILLPVTY